MNLIESIRQEILTRAVAAPSAPTTRPSGPTGFDPAGPPTGLTGQQIVAVLSSMDASSSEKLRWQTSIVDLMKLLHLDPSPANLQQLAHELDYNGDTTDFTAMNGWLHGAVMRQLTRRGD